MEYKNHFLFSETYLTRIVSEIKKNEATEYDDIFENIVSWYQEYKEAWLLFGDTVIDTLGFRFHTKRKILCC